MNKWTALVCAVAASGPGLASAATSQKPASWRLGEGFTATIYVKMLQPGSTWARRTLVIQRQDRIVRTFSRKDEGLGIQVAELTNDGVKDILVLNYWDGSGGWGAYTLFGGRAFKTLWRRGTWCAGPYPFTAQVEALPTRSTRSTMSLCATA